MKLLFPKDPRLAVVLFLGLFGLWLRFRFWVFRRILVGCIFRKVAFAILSVTNEIIQVWRASPNKSMHDQEQLTRIHHSIVANASIIGQVKSTQKAQIFENIQSRVWEQIVVQIKPLELPRESEKVAGNFLDFISRNCKVHQVHQPFQLWTSQRRKIAVVALETFQVLKSPANVQRKCVD